MMPVRIILEKFESMNVTDDDHNSSKHRHQVPNIQGLLKRYPITMDVFTKSLDRTRPSTCAKDTLRYVEWEKKHGLPLSWILGATLRLEQEWVCSWKY